MKQKILVTGGLGFVGKNIIEKWHSKYDLVIIDKYEDEFIKNFDDICFIKFDFQSDNNFSDVINSIAPNYLINLVSLVTAERNLDLFKKLIDINITSFMAIALAALDYGNLKMMYTLGSAEEYGNITSPFKESYREEPSSPYALVKQLTTNTALMLFRNYGFPVCVLRPSNLFGKYQPENKFFPYLVHKLLRNETVEMSPGQQKRDFISVNVFLKYFELLLDNYDRCPGKIINIGSGTSFSLREICQHVINILSSSSVIKYGAIPYRENEVMDFICSIQELTDIVNENFSENFWLTIDEYTFEVQKNS